ncbi:hypothetical protein HK100_003716 [Physocladia obscura]|uniref:BZIP domain-containing protein n=1 Tax=Physocladia obscura TaxID=109957 RepID=A0AAD5SV92_9FUNG|nr:hypothetical protein HK100_003716 [Physocladia obscura]
MNNATSISITLDAQAGIAIRSNKANTGRPRTTQEAPSHRAARNRESQRALRDRKAKYISNLEETATRLADENTSLKATLETAQRSVQEARQEIENLRKLLSINDSSGDSSITANKCLSCTAERIKSSICMQQVETLEVALNKALEFQNQATNSNHTTPTTTANNPAFDINSLLQSSNSFSPSSVVQNQLLDLMDVSLLSWIPNETPTANSILMTSEELYGPLEVESLRIATIHVTSLRKHPDFVNHIRDLFVAQTKVSDVKEARRILVKFNRALRDLRMKIDFVDYIKLYELYAIYQERNSNHERHFCKLCAPPESVIAKFAARPLKDFPPSVKKMQETLYQIPTLKDSRAIIDQLCNLWVARKDENIDGEAFFYFNHLMYQLEIAARNVEDRMILWQAYDVLWAADHETLDEFLVQVESISIV